MRNNRVVEITEVEWDEVVDVVVVGAGAAGFPAAITAASNGAEVVLLEKAGEAGGTMRKSGAWHWIPNNSLMRAAGQEDDRDQFLRYVARLTYPLSYSDSEPRYGVPEWEWDMFTAFYDHGARAIDALTEIGALKPVYSPWIPDYHVDLEPPELARGRTLQVRAANGEVGEGHSMAELYLESCERLGVPVRCHHRVDAAVVDGDAVVGVRAEAPDGVRHIGARRGVIFCSGGFTHSPELRRRFLPPNVVGGCSALSNEGDFVEIATGLGLPLRNMDCAWSTPVPFEAALSRDPEMSGMFTVAGDSMIWVDRHGRRVVNEKASYNELARALISWDTKETDNPRFLMTMVWDQAAMERASGARAAVVLEDLEAAVAGTGSDDAAVAVAAAAAPAMEGPEPKGNDGNIVYKGPHLVRGAGVAELAERLRERLREYGAAIGSYELGPDFEANLTASITRFNELAAAGADDDFGRGDHEVERIFSGELERNARGANSTMYPLDVEGGLYAAFVASGVLDTKGGATTDDTARALNVDGDPVSGLYAAGNCAAVASGHAYWGGGATIGPAMTFGFLAGEHAARSAAREIGAGSSPVGVDPTGA